MIWGYHFSAVVAQSGASADQIALEYYNRSAEIEKGTLRRLEHLMARFDAPGAPLLTFLSPTANFQIAFRPGQHRLVARPTGAAPGTRPRVTWSRRIEIAPRVRGFKLQSNEADFR